MPTIHWKQKNIWGDAFYLQHIDHPYYGFWLFRDTLFRNPSLPGIPKEGDEILWPDKEGVAHLIVTEVEWKRDPHDMYWVKAWMIGKIVIPELREVHLA